MIGEDISICRSEVISITSETEEAGNYVYLSILCIYPFTQQVFLELVLGTEDSAVNRTGKVPMTMELMS